MVVVTGSATSDLDVAFFREHHIARASEGLTTTLMTTRYRTTDNCVIQRDAIDTLRAIFEAEGASEEEKRHIRELVAPLGD
jgi:hypothetical protein